MSRQLLADPEWPDKVKNRQITEIHRCVRCNKNATEGLQHQGNTLYLREKFKLTKISQQQVCGNYGGVKKGGPSIYDISSSPNL